MGKFERRSDGTFFPSDELLREVKKNPEKYPDAVADFSKLSGESESYIRGRIEASDFVPAGASVIKGMIQAAENALALPTDLLGKDEVSDQIKGAVSDRIYTDPDSLTQNLGQVAGQLVAPVGLAGPIAKSLSGAPKAVQWIGTALAEGGLSAVFLDADQNLVNVLKDFGIAPEAIEGLAANEEDSNAFKRLKTLVTDGAAVGVVGLGLAAGSKAASALFRRIKSGEEVPPEELSRAVEEIQQELYESRGVNPGAGLDDTDDALFPQSVDIGMSPSGSMSDDALAEAVEAPVATQAAQAEFRVAEETAPPLTEREAKALKVQAAREQLKMDLDLVNTGIKPDQLPKAYRVHIEEALAPVKRYVQTVTDPIERTRFEELWKTKAEPLAMNNAVSVFKAIQNGEIEKAVRIAKRQVDLGDATVTLLHQAALIRTTLRSVEGKFDEIIKEIRANPKLKTKKAYQQVATQVIQSHVGLHEVYRSLGRSASYQMLLRQDGKVLKEVGGDFGFVEEIGRITDEVSYSLFPGMSQELFTIARAKEVFDLGLNPLDVLEEIDRLWKDFQGVGIGYCNRAEIIAEVSSNLIRNIKEVQNTALLSTLTTTGTNVISTALQTVAAPVYRIMNGEVRKGLREYVGYMHGLQTAMKFARKAWDEQLPVLNRADRMEVLTGSWLKASERKTLVGRLFVRAFKAIVDMQLATDEFFRQVRFQGVRYADGVSMAKAAGKTGNEAHEFALKYLRSGIAPDGRGLDPVAVAEANRVAFNEIFDDRYATGKFMGWLEKKRMGDDATGLAATLIIPFQRTPIAIFNTAMHTTGLSAITAPPAIALDRLARRLGYKGSKLNLKIHDDLIGFNGARRAHAARAQMAIGAMLAGTLYYMEESGLASFRGPTKMADWKGQRAERDLLPPNSLIVGNETYDLTRWLPFSAPLIAYGAISDAMRDTKLTQTGKYMGSEDPYALALHHMGAYSYANYALLRDAASLQGISNLMQGLAEAFSGDYDRLKSYAESIPQQFIPGQLKIVARATQDEAQEGFDFWTRLMVTATGTGGYRKLDVFGNQVRYNPDRAFYQAPYNVDHMAKPHYQEVYTVMQMTGKPIGYTWPTQVFARDFSDAGFSRVPSLHELETTDGKNAWEAYRDLMYRMKTGKTLKVTVSGTNTGLGKGNESIKLEVPAGLNFEKSVAWLIERPEYQQGMDYEVRRKAIEAIQNQFEANAKETVAARIKLPDEVRESYQFGEVPEGTTLADLKTFKYQAMKIRRTVPDTAEYRDKFQTIKSPLEEAFSSIQN